MGESDENSSDSIPWRFEPFVGFAKSELHFGRGLIYRRNFCKLSHIDSVCVNGSVISNLRFADDISLLSDSDQSLQLLVDNVNTTSNRFRLTISNAKTEVQAVGRDASQIVMHTKVGNNEVQQVQQFVYLQGGSIDMLLVTRTSGKNLERQRHQ